MCVGSTGPSTEVCNMLNDDCDANTDEGVQTTYYRDMDGDNRGAPGMTRQACALPAGYVTNSTDCNDMCNVCWTGASETCDGFDNNCTGGADEGVTTRFYEDADGDTRGNPSVFADACSAPANHVANANDCDDTCHVCWTANADVCDGRDNDCSGAPDETFTCVAGATGVPCMTTCETMGTGVCTAMCGTPAGAACTPPAETCNAVNDDCDSFTDEGARAFATAVTGPIGSAAKLARGNTGFIGIQRYNSAARLYRIDATGTVIANAASVDAADVVSVDIARLSDGSWVTASGFGGGGVNVRLIGLSAGAPASTDVELVNDSGAGGVARVAANSSTDAMTVYQSGSTVRVAHVDFSGAVAASAALPGSTPRAELGMDIAPLGTSNGYVVVWVTGNTPTVNMAIVSATHVVTSNAVLGTGSNPTVAYAAGGAVGVAYVGPDNRPRFHRLTSTLTCVGGAARNTCAITTSTRTVSTPVGAGTFNSTLDVDGSISGASHFWLVARTSDGELVQHLDTALREDIFRTASTTSWMSVVITSTGDPLISRGADSGYNHNFLGCPAP